MFNLSACAYPDSVVSAVDAMFIITYYFLIPYSITIGFVLQIVIVIAFARQAKRDGSFVYQLATAITKAVETFVFGFMSICMYWYAGLGGGPRVYWFVSKYALVFLSVHILVPSVFFSLFLSLSVSLAMAFDRVFAIWKPMAYRKIDQRRHKMIALTACLIISIGLSADYFFLYDIIQLPDGTYSFVQSASYVGAQWAKNLEDARLQIRIGATIVLIFLNALMVIGYRDRMKKLALITITSQEKAELRKEAKKDLTILSVCLSITTCLYQVPHAAMQVVRQHSSYLTTCYLVMAPGAGGTMVVATASEFFVVLLINRDIRKMFLTIPIWKRCCAKFTGVSSVTPMHAGGARTNDQHGGRTIDVTRNGAQSGI